MSHVTLLSTTDGMCLLRALPPSLPGPLPFIPGSRDVLEKTLRCVSQTFTSSAGDKTIRNWQRWATEIAPSDDCVATYLRRFEGGNGLYIPLRYFLMGMRRYEIPRHIVAESRKRTLGDVSGLQLYRAGIEYHAVFC